MPAPRTAIFDKPIFRPPLVAPSDNRLANQYAIAQSLGEQAQQPAQSFTQGLNQLASAAFSGAIQKRADQGSELRQQDQISTLTNLIDPAMFGMTPDQLRQAISLNPELGSALLQTQLQANASANQPASPADLMTVGANSSIYDPNTGQFIQPPQQPETTGNITEYEYAKKLGFDGSLEDWMKLKPALVDMGGDPNAWRFQIMDGYYVQDDPNAPGGYSLVPLAGGPQAQAAADAATSAAARTATQTASADIVLGKIDDALNLLDTAPLQTQGAGQYIAGGFPGSIGLEMRTTLETIKTNLGFDRLQQMRDASPTGGALGQVSELESRWLQNTVSSVDPNLSGDALRRSLEEIRQHYERFLWSLDPANSSSNGAWITPEGETVPIGGTRNGYIYLGGDPTKDYNWRAQ